MAASSSSLDASSSCIQFSSLDDNIDKITRNKNFEKISWVGNYSHSLTDFMARSFGASSDSRDQFQSFVNYIARSDKLTKLSMKCLELRGDEIDCFSKGLSKNRSIRTLHIDFELTDAKLLSPDILSRLASALKNHPTLKNVSFKFFCSSIPCKNQYSRSIADLVSNSQFEKFRVYDVPDNCLILLGQALSQDKGSIQSLHLKYSYPASRPSIEIFFQAFLTNSTVQTLEISDVAFRNLKFLNFLESSMYLERFIVSRCSFTKLELEELAKKLPKEIRFNPDSYCVYSRKDGKDVVRNYKLKKTDRKELKALRKKAPSRVCAQTSSSREVASRTPSSSESLSSTTSSSSLSLMDSIRRTQYGTCVLAGVPAFSADCSTVCSSSNQF
jgi:hypothetical protein